MGSRGLGKLLHVGFLDPANGEDALLGQEVLGHVVEAFLPEDDVRAGLLECVDEASEDVLFLPKEGLQLFRVADLNPSVEFGLLHFEGGVHQGDLRLLYTGGHPGVDPLLVHDDAIDHLAVGDGPALLLHDLDVVLVHLPGTADLFGHGEDRPNGQLGEVLPVCADGLADHGGCCDLPEGRLILRTHLLGKITQEL